MTICKKGIILAGGSGSRLYPMTQVINKHLIPVFDKPMLYYPLVTLMLAGIKDILLITGPESLPYFERMIGDGSQWGIKISYAIQDTPRGLADAFIVGSSFVNNEPVALILGDNIFHGQGLSELLVNAAENICGVRLFAVKVQDPERFGVVEINADGIPISIEEKPTDPKSNLAVTGLYFYDERVTEYARNLEPSERGELEITDLNRMYLKDSQADVTVLNRGYSWFDMGTPSSLLQASTYVEIIQSRQALGIACPEEVSWRMGYLSDDEFRKNTECLPIGEYRGYLENLINDQND